MNLDQLMDSLSGNDPNEGTVLGLVYKKRRAARQRLYAASGGLAVVLVAVLGGFLLRGVDLGGSASSSSSSAAAAAGSVPLAGGAARAPAATPGFSAAAAGPRAQNGASGSGSSSSCAAGSLHDQLARAVQGGASVIVGYGTVGSASASVSGGATYQQVTLRSVQTLAGPKIAPGSTAWVQVAAVTSSGGTSVSPEGQSLWAPEGELFGIVTPAAKGGAPAGQKLRLAPVIGGQVILSLDECWSITGVPARPYHGPVSPLVFGPEESVPASSGASSGTVTRNLYAVPLADAEKAVHQG